MSPRRLPRAVLAAALAAFGLRLGFILLLGTWRIPPDDDHFAFGFEVGRIARSLAEGQGFVSPFGTGQPTAWMPPLYPFLLAGVFLVFGVYSDLSALVVLGLQAGLGALGVPLAYGLGRRWIGERAGRLGAWLLAIYPAAIYFAGGLVWPTTLAVLLLLASLWLASLHQAEGGAESALGGGLLVGLLVLCDPVCLVLVPCLLWAAWRAPRPLASRIRSGALAVVGTLLLLLPWSVRNYLAFGEPVFLKSNFGNELWLGNNDHATGRWLDRDGNYMLSHLSESERRQLDLLSEPEMNRWYMARARAWMKANPRRVLELSLRRAGWFWWRADFETVRQREGRFGGGRATMLLTVVLRLTVVAGLVGLGLALARRRPVGLAVLFLLLYPLGYYLTHVSNYRYRYPVEPVLLVLGAGLVAGRRPGEDPAA